MWAWALWLLPLLYRSTWAALPAKPENISCIYYYKRNFTCTWSPERGANHTWYQVKRTHTFGEDSDTCNSTSEGHASCSFLRLITYPDTYQIQVQARNADGTAESDVTVWDLDTIIKVEPPVISSVKPLPGVKRMLHIRWAKPVSSALNYTLRFRANESDPWMEVSFEREMDGDQAYNLTGLQAFAVYAIALRCAARKSKFWSGWSQEKMGMTEEEAPLGLDVWRILGPAQGDGLRPVTLLWKKARGAPALERTLGYLVRYFPENSTRLAETMNTTHEHQRLKLYLGSDTYRVSVIPYNSIGEGPAATLRVPAIAEKPVPCIQAVQTHLTKDRLVVTWQSSAPDVDTWTVEWLPDLESAPLRWEPVSRARNWTIQRGSLRLPFWCYNISVHPVLQDRVGEPYSAQVYFEQDAPSAGPVTKVENIGVKTVTVTWKELPKSQRNGFISNYTIFCQAENGEGFSRTVDPSTLRYGLGSLTRGTPYTLQVMASTRAGGTNGTRVNFKTLSISVLEVCLTTALVGGGLLILTVLTVAYGLRRPNRLKRLCWPQVPNPARSSLATWRWDGLQTKLPQKGIDDSVTAGDRILKPCPAPSDLIDKLVVNFGNFLEDVSSEESGKGRETILGGENNEYVTSPARPYCPSRKSSGEPPTVTEVAPGKPQHRPSRQPGGTGPGAEELLLPSTQDAGPARVPGDGLPNPYLKNSVTTREFLSRV
ncbi:interleukin-31 receptor subunit alpha [Sturnira hondurensis]|uniref:interleukin-31 receptor subunit alpha n=1 Tax=Sturnira hondurensis TaxID=192404 RepID=UPI00187903E6|nr:interleukin-31 receptor subunit alpha [Sturnira hondurensis]